jgi:hypothetical protein
MSFASLHSLISHKKYYCKLRFTCKCEEEEQGMTEMENSVPSILQCSSCNQDFEDPWDLMEHVQVVIFPLNYQDRIYDILQDVHTLNIFELCDDNQNIAGHAVQ